MPRTGVVFYQEDRAMYPLSTGCAGSGGQTVEAMRSALGGCRLAGLGHELRRPETDFLRDGIHELRARRGRVHYRILYFFHGSEVAVLVAGLSKEGRVPDRDSDRALQRKVAFEEDPSTHTFVMEL